MESPGDPIALQILPQEAENEDFTFYDEDPLAEEEHSPLPGVVHRYPDRVLLYLTHRCAVHCRFCTRKRKVSDPRYGTAMDNLNQVIHYIQENDSVKEAILSGGDPLTLSDSDLREVISRLRGIRHLKSIRIHTRIPAANPARITENLCRVFSDFYPLTLVTHFNHPKEITAESRESVRRLRMSGVHVLNQSVLLKGVNDSYEIMEELVLSLIESGVQPYYLHQCDEVKGVSHFRTDPQVGVEIIRKLRGRNPGISIPRFVIDLPGGGGKIPLEYDYSRGPGLYESSSGTLHILK